MRKTPLVSIITPTYNCGKYIKETIESVLDQTFSDWEMIIVDDFSTDNSADIAEEYSKVDERIILLRQEKNLGCAKARNRGLKVAKGKYISFLDGDDLLDKNYLQSQISFMKDNGPLITASYRRLAPNSVTEFIVPSSSSYKRTLKGCALSCLTTMYDRSVIGDRFFNEEMRKNEDFAFWLGILKLGYEAKGNKEVLASYRILKTSKSHNKIKFIKHMWYVYRKVEKLNFFYSVHCLFHWALYGLKKYKGVN